MTEQTVAAVVVTYNRKQLLTECLDALLAQTRPVNKIILINNASTDGTPELLEERGYLANPVMDYVRLPENTGSAGGFHEGVKRGHEAGYDWLWLMDDDTIAKHDALHHLLSVSQQTSNKIGFVCSRVEWVDGAPHFMNIPVSKSIINGMASNSFDDIGCQLIESCSFVSVLVSRKAISAVGYPFSEMYIWADDVEYTCRITDAKWIGLYYPKSRVFHATQENYYPNILVDKASNLWRYKHGIRNRLYVERTRRGFAAFVFRVLYRLTVINVSIIKNRKNAKGKAVATNTAATLSSLFFLKPSKKKLSRQDR
jgi:hypothetical protein